MKLIFFIFFTIKLHPSFAVFNKNEEKTTKPPPQEEELPWLSFFELNSKTDGNKENFGRKGINNFEMQNAKVTSIETLCPPGVTGQFHYPPDCKRFINCWKGRGSVQICAPGTLFNPETNECDFPGKVKCAREEEDFGNEMPKPTKEKYIRFPNHRPTIAHNPRITRNHEEVKTNPRKSSHPQSLEKTTKELRPQCSIGATGLYPHPYDCSKFLKCWSGNTFIQNCGPGTYFNPLISACDHSSNVHCAHNSPDEHFASGVQISNPAIFEDVSIKEVNAHYEPYQNINLNTIGKNHDKIITDPSSPSYLDNVPQSSISSTSSPEGSDLNVSYEQTSNNRKPKVINNENKKQHIHNTLEKEPVSYLSPPQYNVYGNLINTNDNQPVLGVKPTYNKYSHSSNQNIPDSDIKLTQTYQPLGLHTTRNSLMMNYPPQGPYSIKQMLNREASDKSKNYYGYLLSQKYSLGENHKVYSHHPVHSQNHYPSIYQPESVNSQNKYPSLPIPLHHQFFGHYAPYSPFVPQPPSIIAPTGGLHSVPMSSVFQYPSNLCLPDQNINSQECLSDVSSHQNKNKNEKQLENPLHNRCFEPNRNKLLPSAQKCKLGDEYSQFENNEKLQTHYYPDVHQDHLLTSDNVNSQNSASKTEKQEIIKNTHPSYSSQMLNHQTHLFPSQTKYFSSNSFLSQNSKAFGTYDTQFGNSQFKVTSLPRGSLIKPLEHSEIDKNLGLTTDPHLVPQTSNSQGAAQTTHTQQEESHPSYYQVPISYPLTPLHYGQTYMYPYQPQSVYKDINSSQYHYNQKVPNKVQTSTQIFSPPFGFSPGLVQTPSDKLTPPSMGPPHGQSYLYPQSVPHNSYQSFSSSENLSNGGPLPAVDFFSQKSRPVYVSNIPLGVFPSEYHFSQISKTNFTSLPENKDPDFVPAVSSSIKNLKKQDSQGQFKEIDNLSFGTNQEQNYYNNTNKKNNNNEDDNDNNNEEISQKNNPVYLGNSVKTAENFPHSSLKRVISVSPKPEKSTTFPPFPENTQAPKTTVVKTNIKFSPEREFSKDYVLDKIDLRTKLDVEDVETIKNTNPTENTEKTDQERTLQPEEEDGMEEATKKILAPEINFEYENKIEQPKKFIKKPFVKVRQPPPNGQMVRLRNGGSHLDGYLEMKDDKSKWGLVCDEPGKWQMAEATVACRELGFIRGAELSWQGYPIKSEADELFVAVKGVNCTGDEASLSECEIILSDKKQCDVGQNAVGIRCFSNLASHCQPGEILYNQHCYKLHGKENPDDPGIKTEEASSICKKNGGKLVDITSQYENDFLSEWLVKKHPDVTTVATGGIGISVLGRPMWLWEGSNDPMVYERWWSGWSGDQNIPKGTINGPLCIILKKTFSCSDPNDEGQRNVESDKDEETCSADYFFWDVEDCDKLRTSVFVCERPMDDIGCIVGNGEGYVGTANTTASGLPCLPWDHPKVVEGLARRGQAQERSGRLSGHNYCRNLGNPDRHPWCFVEGSRNSEYCAIPQCWDSGYSRSSGRWTSCDENHFECKPGECIKNQWLCDGQKDCANGRDEEMCKVFIQEFTAMKNKKMKSKGIEKWPNSNENVCAKLCLQNKNFKCRSFSYNVKDKDCYLSDTNIGLSGQVVTAKGWIYHELSSESLRCTLENNFFECHNGKCINISNVCDGKDNCGDGSDEKNCGRLGYEIRLAGTNEKHMGRVEIKVLGKWGVICDDMFDLRDANVVCREVGFPLGAADVIKHSHFPTNNPLFLVDHLECWGNETSIRDCPFPGWGRHNCGPDEVVGVVCRTSGLECPEEQWQCINSKECILTAYLCDGLVDCEDKSDENKTMCESPTQIRLANGPDASAGRLEIKHFGTWGTVCHDDFSVDAGNAVCRMLGYNGPSSVKKNAYFGPGKGPIWLDNGQCLDNETDLEECKKHLGKQNNCKHVEDVSLICSHQMNQKSSSHKPLVTSSSTNISTNSEEKVRQVLILECSGQSGVKIGKKLEQKQEKVVGGTTVAKNRETLPWQASIRVKSGGGKSVHWCGAIVISPYHILTAGHCLRDYKKAAYFIRVGDYDTEIQDPHEKEFEIEHLYIHPNFSKGINLNNDIGLVKIKGEIIFGNDIRPACLAPSLTIYQPGTNCSVSGWGSVSAKSAGFARTLRKAYIPILEPSVCRAPFVYGDTLSDGMFCAGQLDGGVDSCQGDSGGPLMCQHEGREYLFGITSWGHGCGRANKPGVYTNVAHYVKWIQQKIKSSLD